MVIYRLVRNFMSTVQEVVFAFDSSAKKLHAFFDEWEADAVTKVNMEKKTTLRTLCEMRWKSRADALYTGFFDDFKKVAFGILEECWQINSAM
jgi:hypothetical protein